jgi:hypothetical protein
VQGARRSSRALFGLSEVWPQLFRKIPPGISLSLMKLCILKLVNPSFYQVGSEGRKLIFQGVPRTIRDSHRKVRDANDGMIIPRNFALFMSGGDHKELKLRLSGRIWKEIPGKVQGYVFSDGKKTS